MEKGTHISKSTDFINLSNCHNNLFVCSKAVQRTAANKQQIFQFNNGSVNVDEVWDYN